MKKNGKTLGLIKLSLAIMTIGILLCGCKSNPKNFSTSNMTITLTEQFSASASEAQKAKSNMYLKSSDVIFVAIEHTSNDLENSGFEINSLDDYVNEMLSRYGVSKNKLQSRGDYKYFSSKKTINGASYTYTDFLFSYNDSYWLCEFACKTKDYDRLYDDIIKWADSITFK